MLMRNRLLPGSLVLTLALMAGTSRAADLDQFLPNATEGVVTLNVKQLLAAPLIKANLETVKALMLAVPDVQQTLTDIDFDPFNDVDRVVVAIDRDPNKSVILVHGKFDTAKIAAKAEKTAKEQSDVLKVIKATGYTYYSVKPPEGKGPLPSDTLYVGMVDETTMVSSGSPDAIIEAMDKKAGKKKAELKPELQTLLNKADRQQTISIVTLSAPLAATGQAIIQKLNAVTGGITVGDDIKLAFDFNAKSDRDAAAVESELKEGLDQVKALVDLTVNQKKDLKPLADVVNTLKIVTQGKVITLSGLVSKEALNQLVNQAGGQ
jgi:nucleotide-binding universal stress UspA family protein